jgi:hypothetical protein
VEADDTQAEHGTQAKISNQSAFLMIGAGITPLPGSIFVTELTPMIWQF